MDELVDILEPPLFTVSGEVKTRQQAYRDGDWIGVFNLWIVSRHPEPSIIYQQRSADRIWAPGLLDVTAGGHLRAGEQILDGLREAHEELGRTVAPSQLTYLGRKLYAGFNTDSTPKHNVVNIYLAEDNVPLHTYTLQKEEVYAIYACPVRELLRAHRTEGYAFTAEGLMADGTAVTSRVTKDSFPQNYDDYHYKMAILVERYFKGEKNLIY